MNSGGYLPHHFTGIDITQYVLVNTIFGIDIIKVDNTIKYSSLVCGIKSATSLSSSS